MKKLLALLLAFCLAFSVTACAEEDVEMALDIAIAVMEGLEDTQTVQADEEIPPYSGEAYA